jgi:hypothetical protein
MRQSCALTLERSLERIREDEALNVWSYLAVDEAREAAITSDARLASGAPRSALEGRLVALKGNIAVRGWPFEGGLLSRRGVVAEQDAMLVRRLRDAGAWAQRDDRSTVRFVTRIDRPIRWAGRAADQPLRWLPVMSISPSGRIRSAQCESRPRTAESQASNPRRTVSHSTACSRYIPSLITRVR